MKIYVGAILGGPELHESAVATALNKINVFNKAHIGSIDPKKAGIDYVFHIAGSVYKPDFDDVRTAKFSKKQRLLMIQCPINENEVMHEKIGSIMCLQMRVGIELAKSVFDKAKILFDAEAFTEYIWKMEGELGWLKKHTEGEKNISLNDPRG